MEGSLQAVRRVFCPAMVTSDPDASEAPHAAKGLMNEGLKAPGSDVERGTSLLSAKGRAM